MKSEGNELMFTKDVNIKSPDEVALEAGNAKESKLVKTVKGEGALQVFYSNH